MKRTALLLLATTALFLGACTANTEAGEDPAAEASPSLELNSPARVREASRMRKPVTDPTMKLKLRNADPTQVRDPPRRCSPRRAWTTRSWRPDFELEEPSADPTQKRAPVKAPVAEPSLDPSKALAPDLGARDQTLFCTNCR